MEQKNIICDFIWEILDANTVKREEEAIKVDELNVAQIKELRDKVR